MKRLILSSLLIFLLCFGLKSQPLDSPILTEPPDVDIVVPLTVDLQWNAVPGAQTYEVQISTTSDFTALVNPNPITAANTSYQVPAGLLSPFTVYYWRVRAMNQNGPGEFSAPWSFRTAGTPEQEISSLEDVVDNYLQNHMNQANILNHKLDLALHQYNMNHMFQARIHMELFKLRVFILEFAQFISNENGGKLIYNADKIIALLFGDNSAGNIDLSPNEYTLKQNYPNPFNPTTTIEYTVPKNGFVSLKVYDITGKEIASLINSYQNAGSYLVTWDASNYGSGVYLYRIIAGDYSATKRMVLKK
jgi:Secretion system C-terminal sorting domain